MMIPLSHYSIISYNPYKIRVVAASKKIVGLVSAGFVAVIWCILMQFSRLF